MKKRAGRCLLYYGVRLSHETCTAVLLRWDSWGFFEESSSSCRRCCLMRAWRMEEAEIVTPGRDSVLAGGVMEKAVDVEGKNRGDSCEERMVEGSSGKLKAPALQRCKRAGKRKRSLFTVPLDEESKAGLVEEYKREMEDLVKFYGEEEEVDFCGGGIENCEGSGDRRSEIARLVEESVLPFSGLVQLIFQKLGGGVSLAFVRSSVLSLGERVNFGVTREDADVLEDESELCLWRWEVRDLKLLPVVVRGEIIDRRKRRRKISERLVALSAAISSLTGSETDQALLLRTKEALAKSDDEAAIRSAALDWKQKREGKVLSKQIAIAEKASRRESLSMDREAEKARVRERKEAEKAAKERERLQKSAARQEKEAKRQEREKLEKKQQLALQRQASILGMFLKKGKPVQTESAVHSSQDKEVAEQALHGEDTGFHVEHMDRQISGNDNLDVGDLLRSHVCIWRALPRRAFTERWGLRRKPKRCLFLELRLQGSQKQVPIAAEVSGRTAATEPAQTRKRDRCDFEACELTTVEKDDVESAQQERPSINDSLLMEENSKPNASSRCQRKRRKLFQFAKSHRPAFYGTSSNKSDVVRGRGPLKKEPSLDYEFDSDEEWEEEDPGESLSDCEKDEDDEKAEAEEEDENSDGFMVPDGYLSESEGVHLEDDSDDNAESFFTTGRNSANLAGPNPSEDEFDLHTFERLQKVLDNATEHAIKSNRPFIICLLRKDCDEQQDASSTPKGPHLDVTKTQRLCLQALRFLSVSPKVLIEPRDDCDAVTKSEPAQETVKRGRKKRVFALSDTSYKEFVQVLMSSSQGIKKTRELLVEKFPEAPKRFLNAKIHEIAQYVDRRWQLKSEG